jgi:signal recognition particle GTPase
MAAQHEFDVAVFIAQIDSMNTLEELKALAQTIPSNLGEPAQTNINAAYKRRKNVVQLATDMETATDIELLNSISAERFEPHTSSMTDSEIDQISEIFERKAAELTP